MLKDYLLYQPFPFAQKMCASQIAAPARVELHELIFVCSCWKCGEKVKQQQCDHKPNDAEGDATEQAQPAEAHRLARTVLQEGRQALCLSYTTVPQ